jgi:hypothetical protein
MMGLLLLNLGASVGFSEVTQPVGGGLARPGIAPVRRYYKFKQGGINAITVNSANLVIAGVAEIGESG